MDWMGLGERARIGGSITTDVCVSSNMLELLSLGLKENEA